MQFIKIFIILINSHLFSHTNRWSFHLGLWPNLNPLLILSEVDIVLSIRSLCSLPPTVYIIVYSVVCQIAMLFSSNSLSIVYSVLYSLPPIFSSSLYFLPPITASSLISSPLYYFSLIVFSLLYCLPPITASSLVCSPLHSFPPIVCSTLYFLPPILSLIFYSFFSNFSWFFSNFWWIYCIFLSEKSEKRGCGND